MPREILVDYTTPAGGGFRSVFMFGTASSVASQRIGLRNMLQAIDNYCSSSMTWTIETSGRELTDATGTLTGTWSEPTAYTGVGAVGAFPVADATQALVRWYTDHIINGRFLRGRTYIPGIAVSNIDGGNLAPGAVTGIGSAAQQLINDAVQVGVWHRPVAGSGGQWWAADTADCWNEFAVLRRRRG